MWHRLAGRLKCRVFLCCVLIFSLSVALYVQTRSFDFVEYDDQIYVYQNPQVMKGLCGPSFAWAFRDSVVTSSNWHPLTFLSLMADVSVFGVTPGTMHLHNAVLHGVDAVLLFLFLLLFWDRMYGRQAAQRESVWIALLAALFWAVHPLRAESVAWVSSRKDVLCIFWYLIGTLAYLSGLKREHEQITSINWRACAAGTCYLLAYMSKPTAVVFPVTVILLEYAVTRKITWRRNELLLYLAVAFAGVTVYVQDRGGALDPGTLGFSVRFANAVAALGQYVTTTLYPHNLACFYPYEVPIPIRRLVPGWLFLLVFADFLFRQIGPLVKAYPVVPWQAGIAKPAPWTGGEEKAATLLGYTAGLVWFAVALLPVVGLLQVGIAACADRYTYLSGIGLSLVLLVFLRRALAFRRQLRRVVFAVLVLGLAVLYAASYRQVGVWRNQLTLFSHAARVTKGNHLAHCNVGVCYFNEGKFKESLYHFLESAKALMTEQAEHNLASALSKVAGDDYTFDVFLHPIAADDPLAAMKHHALGLIACYRKMDVSAEAYLKQSAGRNPREYQVWEQLGFLYERQERLREAEEMFARASALNPSERGLRAKYKQVKRRNAERNRP